MFCANIMYYYVPVSILVLFLSQIKNYKQMSYLASVAMIATIVSLVVVIGDSMLQIFMYMRIDYRTLGDTEDVEITY